MTTQPQALALLAPRDLDAPLAWRGGRPLSARRFIADAQRAAARIPDAALGVVDLCADRYDFAVMMAAALLRGLPTLMPPNAMASTLALLQRSHPGAWVVDQLDGQADEASVAAVREPPPIDGDLQAAILLTSGSTGAPVPHGRCWRSVVLNAQAQAQRMAQALGRADLNGLTLVATRRTTASPTWTTYGELRIGSRRGGDGNDEGYWVQGGHVFEPTPLADILELDDAQHFRLLGRSGDLIHVAGKRSSLAHLNHHLNSIPGVQDGAFWMPDEQASGSVTRPVCFVVAPALTPADIARELHRRVDAVFVPRKIVRLDALAHEDTGKITAATLRALARQHGLA